MNFCFIYLSFGVSDAVAVERKKKSPAKNVRVAFWFVNSKTSCAKILCSSLFHPIHRNAWYSVYTKCACDCVRCKRFTQLHITTQWKMPAISETDKNRIISRKLYYVLNDFHIHILHTNQIRWNIQAEVPYCTYKTMSTSHRLHVDLILIWPRILRSNLR